MQTLLCLRVDHRCRRNGSRATTTVVVLDPRFSGCLEGAKPNFATSAEELGLAARQGVSYPVLYMVSLDLRPEALSRRMIHVSFRNIGPAQV